MNTWKAVISGNWKYQENPNIGLDIIDFYKDDFILGTHGRKYPAPAVARCSEYIRRKDRIKYSRKHVLIRDRITCMYCGKADPSIVGLTLDHVISRDEWRRRNLPGTPTKWSNIVTSCLSCNAYKANNKLVDTTLRLLNGYRPAAPSASHYILSLAPWQKIEPEWEPYLTKRYKEIIEIRRNAGYGAIENYLEDDENDDCLEN